ncbi:hypothetical protein FOZ63_002952 [Perkinsus olseni]|uniref:Uncharacterized protein n=1 Tax=Perkinsus olseni TaxID=32597 RepID=A0A7J6RRJ3_PEROL|nr:hypothetical protein FOZ63_002952 [Perkinsus olseni]
MGPKTTRSSRRKTDDAENSLGDSTGSHYTGQDDTKVHEANPDDDHQADQHELGQPKKSPIEDEAAADSNTVEGDPSQKTSQNEESKKEEGGQEDGDIHDNDPLNDPHISAADEGIVSPFEDDFDEIPEDGTGQTALNKVTTDDLQVRGGLRPPNDTRAIAQAVPPRPAIPQGDPQMRTRGYLLPEQGMHGRQVENYHDPRGSSKPVHLKTIEERPPQPQRSGPPLRRRSTEWYENDYYHDDGHNLSRSSRWSEEEWDDWQEHQDRQKISKVISDVEWITPILGKDKYWDGSVDMPDSVALSEFRYKLTTSPDFEYQSECHKYFTVRHNLSDSIKKLLDVYEHNSDLQPETYHQPHKLNSRYWSDRLKQLWRYLSPVFGDSDGGFLETQWINMYLKKTDKFIDFYAHHESVAKELARTRGYKSLTEQEKKSHFYNCMPAKLKVHLDEQGYWTPGVVNYDRLILLAQSWCRVHWDKAVTVNHVDVSHPAKKTTDSEERDREPPGDLQQRPRSSEPVVKSYPVKLKVRDDEKVLNDPKNQEILQASCGRCLDTHKADTCCNPISYKEQRCRFCGLFHDLKTRCPEKFDSYQKKCPRCGRPNHGLSAIFIDNPGMGTSHYVDFQINDCEKTSRALLDSGAAMSVIHADELAKVPNVVI